MSNPIADNLIESLQQATNLDLVHQCCSNSAIDKAAPWFSTWVVTLCNEERAARARAAAAASETDPADFTMVDLSRLPLLELQAGHSAAIACLKLAYAVQHETTAQFCWRLLEMFVVELHFRLETAVRLGAQL